MRVSNPVQYEGTGSDRNVLPKRLPRHAGVARSVQSCPTSDDFDTPSVGWYSDVRSLFVPSPPFFFYIQTKRRIDSIASSGHRHPRTRPVCTCLLFLRPFRTPRELPSSLSMRKETRRILAPSCWREGVPSEDGFGRTRVLIAPVPVGSLGSDPSIQGHPFEAHLNAKLPFVRSRIARGRLLASSFSSPASVSFSVAATFSIDPFRSVGLRSGLRDVGVHAHGRWSVGLRRQRARSDARKERDRGKDGGGEGLGDLAHVQRT